MSTFTTLKSNVRGNLNDNGIVSYNATDMDSSFQDAYDDIAAQTQCIIKKVTLNWTANLSYYNMPVLVSDFLACVAIFNNVNNRWLDDDLTIRHFDQLRTDWELANNSPTNWAALNFRYVAVFPKYASAAGTFDLYYWAVAPVVVDGSTPLIATDMQHLLEKYSTADLLEQFEEINTAATFWDLYIENTEIYKERVKNISKADLMMIV